MTESRDWTDEIGTVIRIVQSSYFLPEIAASIGEVFRSNLAAGSYAALPDEAHFAQLITEHLQSVNGDQHLFAQYSEQSLPERPEVDTGPLRAEQAMLSGHGFVRVERLPGNVAVLDIRKFYDPTVAGAGAAATAAMNLAASADVLLLDLRRNGGGEPEMVALVSSFLFDSPTHLLDLYFPAEPRTISYWTSPVPGPIFGGDKPIYVLTSKDTISGGEGISYQLQQSGRAVLIGETTAGAANFHYPQRVSEHLLIAVPSGYPIDPNSGTHWEGVGVVPDIATTAERAFPVAHRMALEHVIGLGTAGARRRVVEEAKRAIELLDD